jgi:hypothetical protein
MSNTSATGGFLAPAANPAPLEGSALNAFLHDLIAGVTGIADDLVRPRWQPEAPNLPDSGTTWCAFGITRRKGDFNAFISHDPTGDGADTLSRHEDLDVLTSFYSSSQDDADLGCELLREGLQIPQNLEQLQSAQWGLIDMGDATPAPTLVKDIWLYRSDITTSFRRLIQRSYPILNLLSAQATVINDSSSVTLPMVITNPVTP